MSTLSSLSLRLPVPSTRVASAVLYMSPVTGDMRRAANVFVAEVLRLQQTACFTPVLVTAVVFSILQSDLLLSVSFRVASTPAVAGSWDHSDLVCATSDMWYHSCEFPYT